LQPAPLSDREDTSVVFTNGDQVITLIRKQTSSAALLFKALDSSSFSSSVSASCSAHPEVRMVRKFRKIHPRPAAPPCNKFHQISTHFVDECNVQKHFFQTALTDNKVQFTESN
jgi:hypothetical protein